MKNKAHGRMIAKIASTKPPRVTDLREARQAQVQPMSGSCDDLMDALAASRDARGGEGRRFMWIPHGCLNEVEEIVRQHREKRVLEMAEARRKK
jgi:hypothetical protein